MSKPKKSIIANFGLLSANLESTTAVLPDVKEKSAPASSLQRVGAGVIGAAQRAIGDIRDERDRLKLLLDAGGGGSTDMDPALIDASPFPDRLPDDDDREFVAFRRTIEEEGQKIPIQVRPHPTVTGRYQVIYGHRRLRAARDLGIAIKVLIIEMSDRDLVVAQGIENATRQDLSWCERALFASRMDAAGIKPRDIYAALSIDDAELARMRALYRAVPLDVLEAIGRAPKIGRPRWGEFAKAVMAKGDALSTVRKTLSNDRVSKVDSNERFRLALEAVKDGASGGRGELLLQDRHGTSLGTLRVTQKEMRIVAATERGVAFASFLRAELPALIERFSAGNPVSALDDKDKNPVI